MYSKSIQILLIENDSDIRRIISAACHEDGFRVMEASDNLEALDFVRKAENPIDLLIEDLDALQPDGREMVPTFQSLGLIGKVLLLSGVGLDSRRNFGNSEVILKPFRTDSLLDKVREMVGRDKIYTGFTQNSLMNEPARSENGKSRQVTFKTVSKDTMRALVVDDDASNMDVIAAMLSRNGFQTSKALTAEQALRIFAASGETFDLIVLDMNLHGISGLDIAKQLMAKYDSLRFLFTSGWGAEAWSNDVIQAILHLPEHRYCFLPKPFTAKSLAECTECIGRKYEFRNSCTKHGLHHISGYPYPNYST